MRRILVACLLFVTTASAWADLIYVFPFRDGSLRTLTFHAELDRVHVVVGRVIATPGMSAVDSAKARLAKMRDDMRQDHRDPQARLNMLLYSNFPMQKSFSVPVRNFSWQLAQVIDENSWLNPKNDKVQQAIADLNFDNRLGEIFLSSQDYEHEGLHEAEYLANLQNYLLGQYRKYVSRVQTPVRWSNTLDAAENSLNTKFANSSRRGVVVLNDEALDFAASLFASAFMKIALVEEIYGLMATPYPYVHGDLQRNLGEKIDTYFPNSNIWMNSAKDAFIAEGRLCAMAIDREMDVLRHLGLSFR